MKRLRKQPDGTFHLNDVQPHPAGLSTSGEIETTIAVLTQDEVDAIVAGAQDPVADPVPAAASDTSKAAGLSNASAPAAPATEQAPVVANTSVDVSVLDGTVDEVTDAVAELAEGDLMALRETEVAGKDRKGVLAAIDARLDALTAPPTE